MKRGLLLSISLATIAILAFTNPPGILMGRWEKRINKDVLMRVVFRSDSSYEGFINGKSFLIGKYYMREDTFRMADGACNTKYYGTYKVDFVKDSIRFRVIQDTCRGRRTGSNGLTLGRVSKP